MVKKKRHIYTNYNFQSNILRLLTDAPLYENNTTLHINIQYPIIDQHIRPRYPFHDKLLEDNYRVNR